MIANSWHFFALTKNGDIITVYIDGTAVSSATSTLSFIPSSTLIGAGDDNGAPTQYYPGGLSNVQFYNTSLSVNDIAALYNEGIDGAPQNTQNLVGWWPLNGNANDYSGNNNNGAATNVIYTSSWTSGYTQP